MNTILIIDIAGLGLFGFMMISEFISFKVQRNLARFVERWI